MNVPFKIYLFRNGKFVEKKINRGNSYELKFLLEKELKSLNKKLKKTRNKKIKKLIFESKKSIKRTIILLKHIRNI